MQVDVKNRLPRTRITIHHCTITVFGDAFLLRDFLSGEVQAADNLLIFGL